MLLWLLTSFFYQSFAFSPYPSTELIKTDLETYAHHFNSESLILNLFEDHKEELFFVILNLELPEELISDEIVWRDPRVNLEAMQFYYNLSASQLQSVAYHIASGVKLNNFETRPLEDKSLIALKSHTPRHAVYHEYLHFFIHINQSLNPNVLNESLLNIINGVGEEVFIDTFLINNKSLLQFSSEDLCMRQRYLFQNLRLLSFLLTEINSDVLTLEGKSAFLYLNRALTSGRRVSGKYNIDCFLLRHR